VRSYGCGDLPRRQLSDIQGEEILSSSCFNVFKEGEVAIRKHGQALRSRGVGRFSGGRSLIEKPPPARRARGERAAGRPSAR
jgi:hypothetical protein